MKTRSEMIHFKLRSNKLKATIRCWEKCDLLEWQRQERTRQKRICNTSSCRTNKHNHNGVVEQAIRTITTCARAMLIHAIIHNPQEVQLELWPFAVKLLFICGIKCQKKMEASRQKRSSIPSFPTIRI